MGYLPKDARTNYVFRIVDIRPMRAANEPVISDARDSSVESLPATELQPASTSVASVTESPSPVLEEDFATRFESVFSLLDRERGSHNFVKLSDLRTALPEFDRPTFDRGVWLLRKERRFTANSSDGNYEQLSPEDRSAGIREGDSLLIYISRL